MRVAVSIRTMTRRMQSNLQPILPSHFSFVDPTIRMEHTYLRYECADSFGLSTAFASSKAPPSNAVLSFLGNQKLLTTAGSYILGWDLKTGELSLKLGHREQLSGGVGTGRALNSDEVVCVDVSSAESSTSRVATGWTDGAVRVFDVHQHEAKRETGVVHSLLETNDDEEFCQREPLVLNGHDGSPVRTVAFDRETGSRLASGGSSGTIIVWDVIAETGLFRLIGHRGGITDLVFLSLHKFDGLLSASLDGLVKVWALDQQCCLQTIANHRGEVWASQAMSLYSKDGSERWRLVSGGSDGRARVWNIRAPTSDTNSGEEVKEDEICQLMGHLLPPPNVSTSNERISCIRFNPSGRYVGVLQQNAKAIDLYCVRSAEEAKRKRQRRLKRRQEKVKVKAGQEGKKSGQKRGILDDPAESDNESVDSNGETQADPEAIKASDEFEYMTTVRADHKIRSFTFQPVKEAGELVRLVCSLATNAIDLHAVSKKKESSTDSSVYSTELISCLDFYGHPTGIRSLALASDDSTVFSVSKNVTKLYNVASRKVLHSFTPSIPLQKRGRGSCYCLCATFIPGNTHVVIGTREGHLLVADVNSGDIVSFTEKAHEGAVWMVDVRPVSRDDTSVAVMTCSADKTVKFYDVEVEDDVPTLVHRRLLQMNDDVVAARYSRSMGGSKRLVFLSTLDSTVKVFYEDSLKLFLSLYGHKLPVLAFDASDDDALLATGGADKCVKVWGLDFGDTHKTFLGHEDSITDLKFVNRTHMFFTASKDSTIRYWDADRFTQVLLLTGHCAETNCLAIGRTGAMILSGGMDRQIRVWERTQDMVFVEEENERNLEASFDKVDRDEGTTAAILDKHDDEAQDEEGPQTEAAVKKSILSISAGDRIMDALEKADQERSNAKGSTASNPMMLGMTPVQFVHWVMKSIKPVELEQSLLVLPIQYVERLLYYIILLLKRGEGIELCSKIGVFLVKTHQKQVRNVIVPRCSTLIPHTSRHRYISTSLSLS